MIPFDEYDFLSPIVNHPKDDPLLAANNYYNHLYNIASTISPNNKIIRIAEIGSLFGYSAFSFLSAAPNSIVYGFDNESYTPLCLYHAQTHIAAHFGTYQRFIPFRVDTRLLPSLPIDNIDLFYVDGSHTYYDCLHDLNLALATLAPRGHILIDDISFIPAVKAASDHFYSQNAHRFTKIFINHYRGAYLLSPFST